MKTLKNWTLAAQHADHVLFLIALIAERGGKKTPSHS